MNIDKFEKKYQLYGGIKQLIKMRNSLSSQSEIAKHFRVSKERVRQWMVEMFNSNYDPRQERREKKIKEMVNFYFNNSPEDFKRRYKYTAFYRLALKRIENTIS